MQCSNSIKFAKFDLNEHIEISCAEDTIRELLLSRREDKMNLSQINMFTFHQQQVDVYAAQVHSLVVACVALSSLFVSAPTIDEEEESFRKSVQA